MYKKIRWHMVVRTSTSGLLIQSCGDKGPQSRYCDKKGEAMLAYRTKTIKHTLQDIVEAEISKYTTAP